MIKALGVLVLLAVLAGCSATPSPAPAGTGGDGAATSGPAPGPSTGSGTDEIALPATFPRDEVPLIEGDLVFAQDLGTGWSVYVARDDFLGGYDEAVGLLTDAGFTGGTVNQDATGAFGNFTSDAYTVNLQAGDFTDLGIGPSVGYTVVTQG
ncbi:MAG: hypothetical protein AB7K08_13945 [Microbacteriaceae bacterium]